jgi:hypothetical protein
VLLSKMCNAAIVPDRVEAEKLVKTSLLPPLGNCRVCFVWSLVPVDVQFASHWTGRALRMKKGVSNDPVGLVENPFAQGSKASSGWKVPDVFARVAHGLTSLLPRAFHVLTFALEFIAHGAHSFLFRNVVLVWRILFGRCSRIWFWTFIVWE